MEGDGEPDSIAIVMEEMAWYFSATRYSSIIQSDYAFRDMFGDRDRDYWDDRDTMSKKAKNKALREYIRSYPSREAAAAVPGVPWGIQMKILSKGFTL